MKAISKPRTIGQPRPLAEPPGRMSYAVAMDVLRKVPTAMVKGQRLIYGARVRHKHMGKGWSIFYIALGSAKGFYCLNPTTGSNYAFAPSDKDREAETWKVV